MIGVCFVWSHLALFDPSFALETIFSPDPSFSFYIIMAMANQTLPFGQVVISSTHIAHIYNTNICTTNFIA